MHKPILISMLVAVLLSAPSPLPSQSHAWVRYPNELPSLKLYEEAKWSSIIPCVSKRRDVERVMGQPARIFDPRLYDNKFHDYIVGYVSNGWIVVITYDQTNPGDQPLDDKVFDITLYPKQSISVQAAEFPSAFRRSTSKEGDDETTIFGDEYGLVYVIYSNVKSDTHYVGQLKLIRYAAGKTLD